MTRWMTAAALVSALACAGSVTEREADVRTASPDAFAGAWRSMTPPLEFIRLSVSSTSSEMGTLAARLTFSGVAWEGRGRIDGDSLVIPMRIPGATVDVGAIVARPADAQGLRLQVRPAVTSSFAATEVMLVRDP